MTSNNSFSNGESTDGQTILGNRGVDKENSGRVRDVGSSISFNLTVPYQSRVSYEEHCAVSREICRFLFDHDIANIDRIPHLFDGQLSENEWNEISKRPEDYPFILAAKGLRDEVSQRRLGNWIYRQGIMSDKERHMHYNRNQWVWIGRAVELFPLSHAGRKPTINDLINEITGELGSTWMAFYAMKTGTGRKIDYLDEEGLQHIQSYKDLIGN